jgi:hypothetical protein
LKGQRTCLFCSAAAEEREHVIPEWMPRYLGLEGQLMSHDQARGVTRAKHVRVDKFMAKIICSRCHDMVNDTIESPAVSLLKDVMRAEARLLTVEQQRALGAWGAKTACMQWAMMQVREGVPIAHRRHLITNAEPHPGVFVAYARCAKGAVRSKMAPWTEITLREDGRRFRVYDFAFVFEALGLKVYGPCNGRTLLAYKGATSFATVVWPPTDGVARWPPGRVLDGDVGFDELWDFDPRAGRQSRPG